MPDLEFKHLDIKVLSLTNNYSVFGETKLFY